MRQTKPKTVQTEAAKRQLSHSSYRESLSELMTRISEVAKADIKATFDRVLTESKNSN